MPAKTATPKRDAAGAFEPRRLSFTGEDASGSASSSAPASRVSKTPLANRFHNAILKTWSIASLDDILPPDLRPPSWTEHLLTCLSTLSKHENLQSARKTLENQIRRRVLEERTQSKTVMTLRGYLTKRDADEAVRAYKNSSKSSSSRETSAETRDGNLAVDPRTGIAGGDSHGGTENPDGLSGTDAADMVVDEIVVGLGSEASDSAEEASRTESGKQTRTKKWPKRGDIAAYQRSKPAEEGGVASRASPSVDLASLSAVKNRGASTRRATSRTTPGSRNKQQADSQPVSAQKDESGPAPKTETAAAEPAVNWLRRSAVNSSINPDGRTSVNINTVAPPTNSSTQGDTARAIPPLQPQKQDLVPLPDPKNSAGHTLNQAQPASGTPVTSATSTSIPQLSGLARSSARGTDISSADSKTHPGTSSHPASLMSPQGVTRVTQLSTQGHSGQGENRATVHTLRQIAPAANVSKSTPAPPHSLADQAPQVTGSSLGTGNTKLVASVSKPAHPVQELGLSVSSSLSGGRLPFLQPSVRTTGLQGATTTAQKQAINNPTHLAGSVQAPPAVPDSSTRSATVSAVPTRAANSAHGNSTPSSRALSQNTPVRITPSSTTPIGTPSPSRGRTGLPATRPLASGSQPSAIAPKLTTVSGSAVVPQDSPTVKFTAVGSQKPAGPKAESPPGLLQQSTAQQPAQKLAVQQPVASSHVPAHQAGAHQKSVSQQPTLQKTTEHQPRSQLPGSQQPVSGLSVSQEPGGKAFTSLASIPKTPGVRQQINPISVSPRDAAQQAIAQQPVVQQRVSQQAAPQHIATQKPGAQPSLSTSQQSLLQHSEGSHSASSQRIARGAETSTAQPNPATTPAGLATATGSSAKRKQPPSLIMQIMAAEREKIIAEAQLNYARISINHERSTVAEQRAILDRLATPEPALARQIEAANYLQGFADWFGDLIKPKPDDEAMQVDGGGGQSVGADIQAWWNWTAYAVAHIKDLLKVDTLTTRKIEAKEELDEAEERLRAALQDERVWAGRLAEQTREIAALRAEQEAENARKRPRIS